MRINSAIIVTVWMLMFFVVASASSAERALWTTSKVVGSPDPPDPYRLELAYPKLRLEEPLSAAVVPGSKRLMVAGRHGQIWVFDASRNEPQPQLIVDLKRTVYGIAVHPQFEKNGFVYVTSVLDAANPSPNGSRLTRLTVDRGETLAADSNSEQLILEWPSGGHNGGCLRFGPDGLLYLATGDGSGIADGLQTGQDISDLLGAILRLDVDHPAAGKAYGLPKDNPFVGDPKARGEIWSFGHRQVWKFSFDAPTGQLWAGEVGQDLWEMVYLIQRGGNYGWSVREGTHPFRPERPKGPGEFQPPIVEHSHTDFRSLTGGWIYRGKRL
ncbi:MAG TPA: PQQ-dependent sugar dehydrogenase, partial [Planctomycetaceae bacterium]|nr:PQQ-dependent sugar dehydrogenase [Planctomycetaceae bacterium]